MNKFAVNYTSLIYSHIWEGQVKMDSLNRFQNVQTGSELINLANALYA